MSTTHPSRRRERAAAELHERWPGVDAQQVVSRLVTGLTHLRESLILRAHDDVEQRFGVDSMIVSSLADMENQTCRARKEIEAYSCVVVDDEVSGHAYLENEGPWFLDWMFRLRIGDDWQAVKDLRFNHYRCKTVEERRMKFVTLLHHALPESAKAPLVLYRLFPRSVRIVAALAFGNLSRAQDVRAEQIRYLPAIRDCHECRGRVLDNDDVCRCCGNPVWNFAWLTSD